MLPLFPSCHFYSYQAERVKHIFTATYSCIRGKIFFKTTLIFGKVISLWCDLLAFISRDFGVEAQKGSNETARFGGRICFTDSRGASFCCSPHCIINVTSLSARERKKAEATLFHLPGSLSSNSAVLLLQNRAVKPLAQLDSN